MKDKFFGLYFLIKECSYKLIHYWLLTNIAEKKIVLTRTACLGGDVVRRWSNDEYNIVNFQKSRVDLIVNNYETASVWNVFRYFKRKDLLPIIMMQSLPFYNKYFKRKVQYVIFDTYSELTDQMFQIGSKKSFFCNYSDLYKEYVTDEFIYSKGLLDCEKIHGLYTTLIERIIEEYTEIEEIIFIDFPATLDNRDKFKSRASSIRQTLQIIEDEYDKVRFVHVDDSDIRPASGDEFPYHFSDETKDKFVQCLESRDVK